MDFAEIEVYSTDLNKNIANTANISASSDYPNTNLKRQWVDGDITAGGHTSCAEAPWMQLDFGKDILITKVIFYPRLTHKGRTRGVILTITNNNNNVIYTANPITSKIGEVNYNDNPNLDGYNYITYNMPNEQWIGS